MFNYTNEQTMHFSSSYAHLAKIFGNTFCHGECFSSLRNVGNFSQ